MEETLLVIDTGSSSMRSVLFDKYGRILEKYQTFYQMKIDGIKATQEIEDFFKCAYKTSTKICGICQTAQFKNKIYKFYLTKIFTSCIGRENASCTSCHNVV